MICPLLMNRLIRIEAKITLQSCRIKGRLTQRLECYPYKVEVGGSNPSSPTHLCGFSSLSRALGLLDAIAAPPLCCNRETMRCCRAVVGSRIRSTTGDLCSITRDFCRCHNYFYFATADRPCRRASPG